MIMIMPYRPSNPDLKPILVYVDGEVRRKLKIKAAMMGTTCADIIRRALAREVAHGQTSTSVRRRRGA